MTHEFDRVMSSTRARSPAAAAEPSACPGVHPRALRSHWAGAQLGDAGACLMARGRTEEEALDAVRAAIPGDRPDG
ncbi:hypothetical protein [Streptomyces sp. NPDC018833]|uniref:hypothetical protein n=1 Tax=Streptomyces sp. NPDC018833 TaxID=3365053 RepID=UPI0037B30AC3